MRSAHLLLAIPFAGLALAQEPPVPDTFAPPVRLKAGTKYLGEKRMYPSPVFFDVNGDGLLDVVTGDLVGKITIALRKPGAPIAYEAETDMQAADGKRIDFHNW